MWQRLPPGSPASAWALDRNGLVTAWGGNAYGQRVVPPGLSNVVAISAGEGPLPGPQGRWHCRGLGQQRRRPSAPFGRSGQRRGHRAAGYRFSLALKSDGTVVKWGTGGGTLPASLTNVIEISAGELFGVARLPRRAASSSGTPITPMPAEAVNLLCLGSGAKHVLAVRSNGALLAWGDSFSGKTAPPRRSHQTCFPWPVAIPRVWPSWASRTFPRPSFFPARSTFSEGQACFPHARIVSPAPVLLPVAAQRHGHSRRHQPRALSPLGPTRRQGRLHRCRPQLPGQCPSVPVSRSLTPDGPCHPRPLGNRALLPRRAATFSVQAVGNGPLACQCSLNGMDLADSATVSGATSPVLVLRSLCPARSGAYPRPGRLARRRRPERRGPSGSASTPPLGATMPPASPPCPPTPPT